MSSFFLDEYVESVLRTSSRPSHDLQLQQRAEWQALQRSERRSSVRRGVRVLLRALRISGYGRPAPAAPPASSTPIPLPERRIARSSAAAMPYHTRDDNDGAA